MEILKNKVLETIDKINQSWVNEIKEAEKNKKGLDITNVMSTYSKNLKELDFHFMECNQRKKKKGLFFK